ncbi:MAG: 50S ribosomal protein L25 [Bacteroidales bacterium]|nr:50S ribosomal protein L25 [Bacteroidales bacterium]
MSESVSLHAEVRTGRGSRVAAKLRKQGRIPAIVYGHGEANVQVSVDAKEFDHAIRNLHARSFALKYDGKADTVLVKELQFDYLGSQIIHVDFERHSATEKVRVTIPVELRNTPKSMSGGVLDQPLHVLHIECSFNAIPESVRIDITDLTLGHPIHVRELSLPEGVTVLDAPDAVVVQVKLPGAEATAEGGEGVQPEVIARKVKDEAAE